MANFNEMGKVELRQACKEAGIKNYGKMNNDGMRAALEAHYAEANGGELGNNFSDGSELPAEQVTETAVEDVVTEPVAPLSPLGQMVQQMMGANKNEAERQAAPAAAKRTSSGLKIEKEREERNGIKKPSVGGQCRAVWDALDAMVEAGAQPTAKQVKELAEERGWNANNAPIEFYQWRKFNGIRSRQ